MLYVGLIAVILIISSSRSDFDDYNYEDSYYEYDYTGKYFTDSDVSYSVRNISTFTQLSYISSYSYDYIIVMHFMAVFT